MRRLASISSDLALGYSRSSIAIESKQDGSPVTEADLAVEQMMRTAIEREFPGDAILGEEFGLQRGLGGRTWIIDPIDRTESYIAGGDSWGLHIALQAHDQIVVAALTRPTANSIWLAVAGGGAFVGNIEIAPREGRRLWVSSQSDVGQARVGGDIPPDSKALDLLKRSCVYDADEPCVVGAVAQGRLDACLDEGGKPWTWLLAS